MTRKEARKALTSIFSDLNDDQQALVRPQERRGTEILCGLHAGMFVRSGAG